MFTWKKYVYEVYKEKSFSKAAQKLFISQPSLSARIKKVEEQVGFPIFDRSTSPLRLTECGEAYIRAAEEIFDIEKNFENYVNNLNELKSGSLAVGASNLFAAYVLSTLITKFQDKFPDVRIQLTEGNTIQLEAMLSNNTLDFVIDNYHYDDAQYSRKLYCQEEILLAVPKKFAVNAGLEAYRISYESIKTKDYLKESHPAVPLERFREVPFIMLKSGNDTRIRGDRLCSAAGFHPNIVLELNQQATAYMASSTQLGATFISDILVSQLPLLGNLVYYKLEGEDAGRQVYFYYKKNKYKTRVMEEFLRMMH